MKAVILSPFFFPEAISTGKYNTELARALVTNAVEVVAVTSYPLYPDWKPKKCEEQLPGITVKRGGSVIRYPRSQLLRRLSLELWFAFYALKSTFGIKNIDLVIAIFPPSIFFYFVSLLLPMRVRRVGVVHDLQGVMYSAQSTALFRRFISAVVNSVEKRIFMRCDKLILLSNSMARKAKDIYGFDDKIIDVCYPFVSINNEKEIGTSLAHMFEQGLTHVVYSGALGDKQNPQGLMRFFLEASKMPGVICHIISRGPAVEELKVSYGESSGVRFHDLVDEENLEEMYARSDIHVIPQVFETAEAAIPSKLPNVIASGAAILAICSNRSELAEIVMDTKTGIYCDSWDPTVLAEALRGLLEQMQTESRRERINRAEAVVRDRFSIDRLVSSILSAPLHR